MQLNIINFLEKGKVAHVKLYSFMSPISNSVCELNNEVVNVLKSDVIHFISKKNLWLYQIHLFIFTAQILASKRLGANKINYFNSDFPELSAFKFTSMRK